MLVAVELVKAGARRGEQNDVTMARSLAGSLYSGFQSSDTYDLGALRLRLDLRGGRSDGVDPLDPFFQQIVQHAVIAAFVFAAEDQVNASRERFQRLDGGVDVRCLGIVVVLDAADGRDIFQPMLHGFEGGDGAADLLRRDARQHSNAN